MRFFGPYNAGGFDLKFQPLKYYFIGCLYSYVEFSEDLLPPETEKVWTISLSRFSGVRRIVIHCNEMEILNFVVSQSTCAMSVWEEQWALRDVKKIQFGYIYSSTATDYYRAGEYQIFKYFTTAPILYHNQYHFFTSTEHVGLQAEGLAPGFCR